MSFLTKLFRKKDDEDYDSILSKIAMDIQKRQVKLSEIRLRERRATLLVTLYTLAGWAAYVALWYTRVLPGRYTGGTVQRAVRGVPVVLGPIVILFIRRIVQIWYTRIGDAEEKTLQQLLKQQRAKVEEIKKKTNYYSTRDLLQRYDEQSSPSTPLRQRTPQQRAQAATPAQTPQQPRLNVPSNGRLQTPLSTGLQTQLSPVLSPPGPPRKQWFDKLADVVLGDEDPARFALICEKCFSHNGLVKESVWEDTQYVCPNCKHFNPSRRSKKQVSSLPGSSFPSPASMRTVPDAGTKPIRNPTPQSPLKPSEDQVADRSMMDMDVEDS
ncbi:hypothetical protein E1B28_008128 [Marasmius oreades]|uniref:Endoplasmic reticulum junction formation protein lunapark n=1 Tax=Marasmius oreades TaxID=181124 RepID=A0A9P7URF9_9AGAR|nr:uncharacterized protein E1B28_008128 [Marasmius oreades]KAG7091727.1 hypothetical protein E1B28_008128 [Marasmius oreades]